MKTSLFMALALLAVTGCGDSSNESSTSAPSIVGTYKSSCTKGDGFYFIANLVASDSNSTQEMTAYSESDSSCLSSVLIHKSSRSYVIGASVAGLQNTYEIDVKYQKVEYTLTSKTEVEAANKAKIYGISDWAINATREVTGLQYSGDSDGPESKKDEMFYTIFKLDGDTYTAGDVSASDDGSTKEKRAKSLSNTYILKKQ